MGSAAPTSAGGDGIPDLEQHPGQPSTAWIAPESPSGRPRGWQRVGLFLLTFLGLNLLVGVAYLAIRLAAEPGLLEDPSSLAHFEESHLVALLLVLEPLTVGLVIFFRRFLDHASVESLGLARHTGWVRRAATGALHATLVMAVISAAVFATAPGIAITHEPAASFALRLLWYVALFAAVGFTEEFVVRGYVLRNLLLDVSERTAAVISALIFAVLHAANPGVEPLALLNVFLVGAYLALVTLRDGSLWYPIGFHFTWNFVLGFVLSLPVSGVPVQGTVVIERGGEPSIFSGGRFGPEGSLVCSAALLVLIAWVTRAGRSRREKPEILR
jgi:membrane protease YdiL (CAAX protease family)